MECTICKKEILGYDHNAQPVAKGRCCERCNHNVVIPTIADKPESTVSEPVASPPRS